MPPIRPQKQEKSKNFKKAWKDLLSYAKKYLVWIFVAILLGAAGAALTIIGPDKLKDMTNEITAGIGTGIDMSAVTKIGVTIVIIYGLSVVFSYFQGFIMNTVTQKLAKRLRSSIAAKIDRIPLSYIDSRPYGEVLSRVTNDVDTVSQSLSQSTTQLVSSITLFLGALIMMFVTNYILAFAAIGSTIVGFVAMMFIMKSSQKYFVKQQISLGKMNGHIEETYSGHVVVQSYNAQKNVTKVFDVFNKDLEVSGWKSQFFSGMMMPIMGFVGNLGYVVVCVVGAALAFSGTISFGVIVAFMIYIRHFTHPLSQIAQSMTSLQSTAAASERVFEFLGQKEMEDESSKTEYLHDAKGEVVFDHVKFGYSEDAEIIHDFSCKVAPGQKVAIVGPTGAGKTTLVNLLMRFYEPWGGKILIDGVDSQKLTRDNVHALFGMVLQDTWLFEGTIRENIVFNRMGVSNEEVENAAKAAGIHHFIQTLPKGYDTVLADDTAISQGQKQLLTIARAFVQNAPMLIFDEATSSVDTRTEIQIQKAMENLTNGRTSFVIAHRLSTIKNADKILVLENGDIVEQGTHDELLAKGGAYAKLYNSQFEDND